MHTERIGDRAILHLGDCQEVFESVPQCFRVDAIVTDPPYGVDFKYESHSDKPTEYAGTIVPRLLATERMLTDYGVMCVFQSAIHAPKWATWFPRDWRPIAITKGFVQMRAGFVTAATDYALMWFPNNRPKTKPDWQPEPARDWFYSGETAIPRRGPERGHPCPRPLDMMKYLISILCPPNSLILDPFMGSGTTGVAAISLGRRFIGCEIEPKYFDIAKRRVADATKQGDMFLEIEKRALEIQGSLKDAWKAAAE